MDEIKKRFQYHPPRTQADAIAHGEVNEILEGAANKLSKIVPAGRAQSIMLTHLEDAKHWANAGIAYARADDPVPTAGT